MSIISKFRINTIFIAYANIISHINELCKTLASLTLSMGGGFAVVCHRFAATSTTAAYLILQNYAIIFQDWICRHLRNDNFFFIYTLGANFIFLFFSYGNL